MSANDDRILSRDDDGAPKAPALILPGAGLTTAKGSGSGAGTVTGSPVIAEPVVPPEGVGAGPDNLAGRIEQILAQDGRFTALLSNLSFSTDDAGHVTLTGVLSNSALKPSLLATVHAVPGVTGVTDETR